MALKTIRIALACFWEPEVFICSHTYDILSRHFNVIIDQQHPDFVIASCRRNLSEVLRYECPRVQIVGEPITPDLSIFDYAVGFDFAEVEDEFGKNRCFRLPYGYWVSQSEFAEMASIRLSHEDAMSALSSKKKFCAFISSHRSFLGEREKLFDQVSSYKHVDSAGTYRNNMPGKEVVKIGRWKEKIAFLRPYKFTIACESMSYPGFVTEKIIHAFAAHSIPIYYGDPLISKTINPKAFINARDFCTESELIDRIKQIDCDNSLYEEMLRQPKFSDGMTFHEVISKYEDFLVYIFSQEPKKAFRRPRFASAAHFEDQIRNGTLKFSERMARRFRHLIRFPRH